MAITNYEEVGSFRLAPAQLERLLAVQTECTFVWTADSGWPMGVTMRYLWADGKAWLTASSQRKRVDAVRRDPRVSLVISSFGTECGPFSTATMRGTCAVLDDAETKQWFLPALAQRHPLVDKDPQTIADWITMMDSPRRAILEVTPVHWLTFDGMQLMAQSGGGLGKALHSPGE